MVPSFINNYDIQKSELLQLQKRFLCWKWQNYTKPNFYERFQAKYPRSMKDILHEFNNINNSHLYFWQSNMYIGWPRFPVVWIWTYWVDKKCNFHGMLCMCFSTNYTMIKIKLLSFQSFTYCIRSEQSFDTVSDSSWLQLLTYDKSWFIEDYNYKLIWRVLYFLWYNAV